MRAHGIAISKYQGRFTMPDAPPYPVDFVIQRMSYGLRMDESYTQLSQDIKDVPIRGAYHYFSSGATWQDQVDLFLSLADGYDFLACDVESAFNNVNATFALGAVSFMNEVKRRTGKRVLLYTNPSVYKQLQALVDPLLLLQFPLWIAQYWWVANPAKNPGMYGMIRDSSDWNFYQYSADGNNKGALYGVLSRDVDLNVYNGTLDELREWLGEPEPPADNTLEQGKQAAYTEMIDYLKGKLT